MEVPLPQIGLPLVAILPVAVEAVLTQDRTDVPVEVQFSRRGR